MCWPKKPRLSFKDNTLRLCALGQVLWVAAFVCPALATDNVPSRTRTKVVPPATIHDSIPLLDEVALLSEALAFYESEGNVYAVETLSNRIMEFHFNNSTLINRMFDVLLPKQNRELVMRKWNELSLKNNCPDDAYRKEPCIFLKNIWFETIYSLAFFEDTAPKVESARRAIKDKKCLAARNLLDQIRSKEGVYPALLQLQVDAAICQKDKPGAKKLRNELSALVPKGLE